MSFYTRFRIKWRASRYANHRESRSSRDFNFVICNIHKRRVISIELLCKTYVNLVDTRSISLQSLSTFRCHRSKYVGAAVFNIFLHFPRRLLFAHPFLLTTQSPLIVVWNADDGCFTDEEYNVSLRRKIEFFRKEKENWERELKK